MGRKNKVYINSFIAMFFMTLVASALAGSGLVIASESTTPVTSAGYGAETGVPIFAGSPYVTASQCTPCHGSDLDKFKNPGLIFKHDPHLARGVRCAGCHTEFPHVKGQIIRPSMTVCYNCHGVDHAAQGNVASGDCKLCHPANFKKVPADHTPAFKAKEHGVSAGKDSFPCLTCHNKNFCIKCHNEKKVEPKNHKIMIKAANAKPGLLQATSDKPVITWRQLHGLDRDKGGCNICHADPFCVKCHTTPMPHPAQWQGQHEALAKQSKNDCKICHLSKNECSDCHHKFEGTTLLSQKTCDSCHDDYNQDLSFLISSIPVGYRNKGIIIHKAHFEMTKTEPFECNECHGRSYVEAKGCFSFQLCYECHGRERGGSLIAKWGGQELCYRCHPRKSQ